MVMKVCCAQGRISGGGGGGGGGGGAAAGAGSSTTGDNAAPVAYAPTKALASNATLSNSRHWFGSYVVCGARAVAASAVRCCLRRMVMGLHSLCFVATAMLGRRNAKCRLACWRVFR